MAWAIVLHGGAGVIPKEGKSAEVLGEYVGALEAALKAGTQVLSGGGSAMKAVEATVRYLEDHPFFNAGRGGVLNYNGEAELDASIMDGKTLQCGAVSGLRTVKNPISLARLVIEKTDHVMLSGAGAEEFADHLGPEVVPRVPKDYFITPRRVEQLAQAKKAVAAPSEDKRGTVGCVAKDIYGHVAAATSTGGMNNKRWGRVGDSPIIGAGTYADDRTCAVSCTGHGEHFIRHSVAHSVHAQMDFAGRTLAQAAHTMIHDRLKPGDGGLIGVDSAGNIVMEFNSLGMFRAAADSAGRWEAAIWEEQNLLKEDMSARKGKHAPLAAP